MKTQTTIKPTQEESNKSTHQINNELQFQVVKLNARIAELEKQNAQYREALEKVKEKVFNHTLHGSFYEVAEQALNSKENG